MSNINEEDVRSVLLKSGKIIITQNSGDFYEINIIENNEDLNIEDFKIISNYTNLINKLNMKYRTNNE